MISGDVWILPALTTAGWLLSWRGPRRLRSGLLSAAAIISAGCIVIAVLTRGTPIGPDSACRPAVECMSMDPVYWAEAGLAGLGCCVALMVVTIVAEATIRVFRALTSDNTSA